MSLQKRRLLPVWAGVLIAQGQHGLLNITRRPAQYGQREMATAVLPAHQAEPKVCVRLGGSIGNLFLKGFRLLPVAGMDVRTGRKRVARFLLN